MISREIQDYVWKNLPITFKDEARFKGQDGTDPALCWFFGEHNLTSKTVYDEFTKSKLKFNIGDVVKILHSDFKGIATVTDIYVLEDEILYRVCNNNRDLALSEDLLKHYDE